ncbi:alpha/beta fold hydrolase [Ekhidna sp.]
MKRLGLLIIAICFFCIANAQTTLEINGATGKSYTLKTEEGNIYYEVFGEGEPLLILHGNGGSTVGKHHLVPALMKDYQVILMDSRCHGNSFCPDTELDYYDMAEDVFLLMDKLGHEKYSLWGHSDGGILSLILGFKHTEKIDRIVVSGANARLSGLKPELIKLMENYNELPDPMLRRHVGLMMNQKEIAIDDLKKIDVPVLLIVGDRDAVLLEHTLEMFQALPQSNLCVLPGASHFVDHEQPDQIIYRIKNFKKPFKAPSTIKIAEQMAKQFYSDN